MKKLLMVGIVAAISALCGCVKEPTVDSVYATFYTGGCTTAIVVNEIKMDDAVRSSIYRIVKSAHDEFPKAGESISTAWDPVVQKQIGILVECGKLTPEQGALVKAVISSVVMNGADYLVARLGIAEEKDLVCAAIDGFSCGFLSKYRLPDGECDDCRDCTVLSHGNLKTFDKEMYIYLKKTSRETLRFARARVNQEHRREVRRLSARRPAVRQERNGSATEAISK